ncbi:unnamed protein product [Linum tenue]|uniref:Branched-chain-amino-acid aminotransferase n=1 Tax=Linum tenue TaxID=586396 RepID=A0AAV0L9Q8_9ROSI|nr:unnamed protein product [Linum tenue]
MERTAVLGGLPSNHLLPPSRTASSLLRFSSSSSPSSSSFAADRSLGAFNPPSLFLKLQKQLPSLTAVHSVSPFKRDAVASGTYSTGPADVASIDWDNLGFGYIATDYMYMMKCDQGGTFSNGELQRFANIELSPSAGVLNYGQGLFEGLKAYMKEVPPPGKGSLYIRPLLMGSGAVLGLAPAPEYTFLIYVSPVGNYFKEGLAPINLIVEHELHRATPGGTGGVKTIGNYAAVLKAQSAAKAKGYSDVLYLDCVNKKYLEEVSSCNIFVVKGNTISTPAIKGTILPGITRKSIIDVARSQEFQVEERLVAVDELLDADEVFCTGTAVVVSPVGSITYKGETKKYGGGGVGAVSQKLYTVLTSLQMGLTEDKMNWTLELN